MVAIVLAACGSVWLLKPSVPAAVISQRRPAALTVSVIEPQYSPWPDTIEANGNTAAWQEAVVGAETGSLRITELHADVGDEVKRGQLLAQLADAAATADLHKQEATVVQARANLAQAEADVKRTKLAADSGALSTQKLDEYRNTEAVDRAALVSAEADLQSKRITLSQTRIIAVDDGTISSRSALLGNVVSAGTELFRIIRKGRIEWQAEVDPQQLPRIRTGQAARVTLPGGMEVDGKVRLVSPTISTNTGRAIVYVALNGPDAQPGMFASGDIELGVARRWTLPESALVSRDGRTYVYVLNSDGITVARRTVVAGRHRDGRCEILAGLPFRVRVVESGGGFLSDGSIVDIVPPQKLTGAAELPHTAPTTLPRGSR
ncbi:efflux transporter periplasmic adaptor subunit [Burkholderia ubonensis]|nr:efflux transporter periplasmic adaptor subunit [Burkholderia ubonensis]PAJ93044.1 efflux transporter periplasmic adaptor subunit [Burkholderia ubonensis]PAK05590.1 efflux transporter periplasmic adaptor subunit [Burkholderia ubonensis]PAK11625.1 efflux transporter periplasmic adaptor subunit [Burkholderia ubonensis]RQP68227.1 efflux RND transporter periplasmic adaptor subunit [Burkholderia ubonensis]